MSIDLVIVESPAKVKTISKFLGTDYVVEASVGHVLDLPKRNPKGVKKPVPGIDLENEFEPTYEPIMGKKKTLDKLKKAAKQSEHVWLATDLDREGEAIAWLLTEAMGLEPSKIKRVVFNAITKDAIQQAFQQPRDIDMAKVNAQQARRILDRIVGYQVSPLLWKKVAGGLSAGRVQSVAVLLVVLREREIRAHIPDESWSVTIRLAIDPSNAPQLITSWPEFMAQVDEKGKHPTKKRQNAWLAENGGLRTALYEIDGKPFKLECKSDAPRDLSNEIQQAAEAAGLTDVSVISTEDPDGKGPAQFKRELTGELQPGVEYSIDSIETKPSTTNPQGPLITSSMQMAASNRYSFTTNRTMRIAQGLYEGVSVPGEGRVGVITYMRTDSTHIAGEALTSVRNFIGKQYGDEYLPEKPKFYGSRNQNAQEAHECIRPTDVSRTPESLAKSLDDDQLKLYRLIWNRFVGCQMNGAVWKNTSVILKRSDKDTGAKVRTNGRVLQFDGHYRAVGIPTESDEQTLPEISEGDSMGAFSIDTKQAFSSPPKRYTEAGLVKKLEEEGIGRPSTYASIIKVIQDRDYVEKVGSSFRATDLGEVVTDKLLEGFPGIMDLGYTRWMESQLDAIEDGSERWQQFLGEFYSGFKNDLDSAHENMTHAKSETELAPEEYNCPECGKRTEYRFGRNGKFLSCTGFRVPPEPINIACPGCKTPEMGVNKGKTARSRPFLTCGDCGEKLTYSKLSPEDKERIVTIADAMPVGCKYAAPIDAQGRPVNPEEVNVACPSCEKPLLKRKGRFGPFLSCPDYPTCNGVVNLDRKGYVTPPKVPPLETDLECNKCEANLYLRTGARGPWLGCSKYPKCKGRGAWKKLEEDVRTKWEALLYEHEKLNPPPKIKSTDGQVIEAGSEFAPMPLNEQEALQEDEA